MVKKQNLKRNICRCSPSSRWGMFACPVTSFLAITIFDCCPSSRRAISRSTVTSVSTWNVRQRRTASFCIAPISLLMPHQSRFAILIITMKLNSVTWRNLYKSGRFPKLYMDINWFIIMLYLNLKWTLKFSIALECSSAEKPQQYFKWSKVLKNLKMLKASYMNPL